MKINSNKIAIFSDLHLGVHQNHTFWHNVSLEWCKWFLDEVRKRKIDTIFFLGDYFHYRDEVAVNTLDVGRKLLKEFDDFKLFMIPGNHDCYYKEHSEINSLNIFNGRKNLIIFNETSIVEFPGQKTGAFVPWGGSLDIKTDYLFGHLEINSFKMNVNKLCEKGIDSQDIIAKARHIYTGHFHLRDYKKYETGTITYVGNPFQMDFGDSGSSKGAYFLNTTTGEAEFVENTFSPKHLKISVSKLLDNLKLSSLNLKGNIIRLAVDKKVKVDDVEKIIAKISSYSPAFVSVDYVVNDNTIDLSDSENCDVAGVSMGDVMKEFIDLLEIDKQAKSTLYDRCLDIYQRNK